MTNKFRWLIASLLFFATAISYLDRLSLPAAESAIRVEIQMTDADYGRLGAYFLAAYAVMYVVGGRIMDWLGTRVGLFVMLAFWSMASMATGFAHTVAGLGISRFLLGVGEGGAFPGAGKAVAEWFPTQERSFAFGIFNTGSALGSVIAVPFASYVIEISDWRTVFYLTGAFGFVWCVVWLSFYTVPEKSRIVSEEELAFIQRGRNPLPASSETAQIHWSELLQYRQLWGLVTAKFLTDAAFYFYSFWIPRYLNDARGVDLKSLAIYGWVPYLFMAGGSSIGGWIGYRLLRSGMELQRARLVTLAAAASIMPISLFVATSPTYLAICFLGLALFGHQFWSSNVQTLVADIFPSRIVGSVEGIVGCAGAVGGALFQTISPWIIASHGYELIFAFTAIVYPLALLILWLIVGKIEPVEHVAIAEV